MKKQVLALWRGNGGRMSRVLLLAAGVAMVACRGAAEEGDGGGLSPEKAEMARVFAGAWRSGEISVGVYSPFEPSDTEYWEDEQYSAERREMSRSGYYFLLLREKLKGNPPKAIYQNIVIGTCGQAHVRPLFVEPGARMVFVLRRLPPGGEGKEHLVFPTSAVGQEREIYMAEEGYAGVGCLEWPEKDLFGKPAPEAPAWYVRLSAEEIEDFRSCGEWSAGKREGVDAPAPMTAWGRALLKWAR